MLNTVAYHQTCKATGLKGDVAVAAAFGLDRLSVWRVRTGRMSPGAHYIGGLMRAWPHMDPREMFIAVDYVPRAEKQAS